MSQLQSIRWNISATILWLADTKIHLNISLQETTYMVLPLKKLLLFIILMKVTDFILKYILHVERHLKVFDFLSFLWKIRWKSGRISKILQILILQRRTKKRSTADPFLANCISMPSHYQLYYSLFQNTWQYSSLGCNECCYVWTALCLLSIHAEWYSSKVSKHFQAIQKSSCINLSLLLQNAEMYVLTENGCMIPNSRYNSRYTPASKTLYSAKKGNYTLGKHDLFAVVSFIKISHQQWWFKSFKGSLIQLIKKARKQCPHLTQAQLLKQMGFPEKWENICRYKLY